eukprot:268621_1
MQRDKLRRAFRKSDFDGDGYLNEFETNHFGFLLFGHKNHSELYREMCKYCNSNPLFGLNFKNILELFPVDTIHDEKDEKDDPYIIKKKHKKHKKKKKKKHKKK